MASGEGYRRAADAILARSILRRNQELHAATSPATPYSPSGLPISRRLPHAVHPDGYGYSPGTELFAHNPATNTNTNNNDNNNNNNNKNDNNDEDALSSLRVKLHTLVAQLKVAVATGTFATASNKHPSATPPPLTLSAATAAASGAKRRITRELHALADQSLEYLDGVLAATVLNIGVRGPGSPSSRSAGVVREEEERVLNDLRASAQESAESVAQLSRVVIELEAQVELLLGSESGLRDQLSGTQAALARVEEEKKALVAQIEARGGAEAEARHYRESVQGQVRALQTTYEGRVQMLEKTSNERAGRIMEMEAHLTTALNNIDGLTRELDDYKAALATLKADRKALKTALRTAKTTLENAVPPERVQGLEARIVALRDKHRLVKERARGLLEENKFLTSLACVYQSTLASATFACPSCSAPCSIDFASFPKAPEEFEAAAQAQQCPTCQASLFR